MCAGCGAFGPGLCPMCASGMVKAGPRLVGTELVVAVAFHHSGVARRLIHDLKYRGVTGRASAFAPTLASLIPPGARRLVPVPRAVNRRIRFGVDPARELADAVGRLTALPVEPALRPPVWKSHHAGKGRDRRAPVRFARAGRPIAGTVVVDDVITTGATLAAAHVALGDGVIGAIVATGAGV